MALVFSPLPLTFLTTNNDDSIKEIHILAESVYLLNTEEKAHCNPVSPQTAFFHHSLLKPPETAEMQGGNGSHAALPSCLCTYCTIRSVVWKCTEEEEDWREQKHVYLAFKDLWSPATGDREEKEAHV